MLPIRQFRYYTAVQTGLVLIGLLVIAAVIYLLILISIKLLGVIFLLLGIWLLIYFPWYTEYQRAVFTNTARAFGLILILIGLLMLIYG